MLRKRASLLPTRTSLLKKRNKRVHPVFAFTIVLVFAALLFFLLSSRSKQDTTTTRKRTTTTTSTPPDGIYDLIILGSGPAGLSAAVFAARSKLSVCVLGSLHGGLLSEATSLENFPGHTQNAWLETTQAQAQHAGATFVSLTAQSVTPPQVHDTLFHIQTELETYYYSSRALIVATGAKPRRLHLLHEDALWGTFIHSCAICDGSAYGPEDVVLVVGGGDAAVAAALYLSRIVQEVIVVHRKTEWTRPNNYAALEQMKASPKIRILTPYVVISWTRNRKGALMGAQLEHVFSKDRMEIHIQGAFLLIGATPNTNFLDNLVALDDEGFIVVSRDTQSTSVPGLFAAGEVVLDRGGYRQAITAAAQGARAAMDAERWLAQKGWLSSGTRQNAAIQQRILQTDPPRPAEGCDLTQTECLQLVVHNYPLVVFSKFSCPYCGMALEALGMEGAHPHVIDVSYFGPKAHLIQTALEKLTGRRTVPNVFVGGASIGGGEDTVRLHRAGLLKEKLLRAGAL